MQMKRITWFVVLLPIVLLGLLGCLTADAIAVSSVCAYLLLMFLPGMFFYRLIEARPHLLEWLLAGLVASPVLTGMSCVIAMLFGLSANGAAVVTASAMLVLGAASFARKDGWNPEREVPVRKIVMLGGTILVLCMLTSCLPLSDEWWRMRSDAWFHGAVIAEIADTGVPPQDPYFQGMNLQYMWIYHVLVLVLSRVAHIDPFIVMPLINIQTLAGFCLATFLLALRFHKRFAYGYASMVTAVLGLNALFWIFLPLKIAPAFVGETRGWSEVTRILSLTPLNIDTVRAFTSFAHNQVFFLDKFIVATAFSLGLCFMAAAWYAVAAVFDRKSPFIYVLLFVACAGMIAFHTIVGFVTMAGLGAGLFVLLLDRWRDDRNAAKSCIAMILIMLAAGAVLSPFVLAVTQGKSSEQLIPIQFNFSKVTSFAVSCALVIILAAFQVGKLWRERTAASRFFIFAALSVFGVCLLIYLPVINMYDKLPFFVFYPLAVAGGWTLAELKSSRYGFFHRRSNRIFLFIVLFAPLTGLHMIGNFATPERKVLTDWETNVASWVRENTSRNAVFFDCAESVFLIVSGPRRYYYGLEKYAKLWDYDKREMTQRERVRNNLFDDNDIDRTTLGVLGNIETDAYVIARDGNGCAGSVDKLSRRPDWFSEVYVASSIHVFEVNRENCRREAGW
jgi:hypothetical protein